MESEIMSTIRQLPVHLVNKIAAGECIERPASIVKELVENSLDAGASKIDVFIEQGGTKLLRVVDNGSGIAPDELSLAIKTHATSKLTDENDLYSILSMGFRGEALASIASVSILKIFSRQPGAEAGASIEVNGGETEGVKPYAGADGTTLEVHNLFFNTPARRKFMKTPATEMNHCQEALIRLALPRPKIAFNFHHNNRQLLQLPPVETPRERIADIFGPELSDTLIQIFHQAKDTTFTGYICKPEHAKPSNRWQYLFVNKRAIRDRYITHALKEAYRGLMPHDRQPVGILFLEIDPQMVDVNVHPAKSEVRFADSGFIHSLVLGAIRDRFLSSDLTATLNIPEEESEPSVGSEKITTERQESVRSALNDFLKSPPPSRQIPMNFKSSGKTYSQQPEPEQKLKQNVLQIHNSYIVAETEAGLLIIDQHAQHERVIYQQLKNRLNSGSVAKQNLLVPEVINLTPAQIAQIEQIRDELDKAGIEVESFGPKSVAVHSVPAMFSCRSMNAAEFIEDLLSRLDDVSSPDPELVLEKVIQSISCKAAVKAGDSLKPEEIQSLIEFREETQQASACPHGRPTALQMTLADLEKQFKRT